MNTEYEIRVLEIDVSSFEKKLKILGAQKCFDRIQKRYVYDFIPKEKSKWIRLRTDGVKTTLAIKNIVNSFASGTKELEVEVSDFDKTNLLLKGLGYNYRNYQENRRIRYYLGDIEIDIDSWPLIPTYVEIEGNSEEEVYNVLEKLGYSREDSTSIGVSEIYKKYGIDIESIEVLKF